MKTAVSLSVPSLRLLVDDIQRALWWDKNQQRWDQHKPWGTPMGLPTLQRIATAMACAGLEPEERYCELP